MLGRVRNIHRAGESKRYPGMHSICVRCYPLLVGPLEDAARAPESQNHKERCCSCACVTYSGLYIDSK